MLLASGFAKTGVGFAESNGTLAEVLVEPVRPEAVETKTLLCHELVAAGTSQAP